MRKCAWMWRSPPTAVDELLQQIRRVRRRRNVRAAQVAIYGVTAVLGVAASLVTVLALGVAAGPFVLGALVVGFTSAVAVGCVVRAAWRSWLRTDRAARWIDATAHLGGRLATLVALDHVDGAFGPLLVAQTLDSRAAWRPERLVERQIPGLALGAALMAVASLVLVVALAPRFAPRTSEVVWIDRPIASLDADAQDGASDVPERLAISPVAGTPARGDGSLGAAGGGARDRAGQTEHAPSLQDRIRRRVWGAGAGGAAGSGSGAGPGDHAATNAGFGTTGDRGASDRPASDAEARAADPQEATSGAPGGSTTGAGDGTDPELFAIPVEALAADGRFALGLGARVHGPRGEPRPPSGDAPDARPDAHPSLAGDPRELSLPPRATVPAEYEVIVRALFTHPEDAR